MITFNIRWCKAWCISFEKYLLLSFLLLLLLLLLLLFLFQIAVSRTTGTSRCCWIWFSCAINWNQIGKNCMYWSHLTLDGVKRYVKSLKNTYCFDFFFFFLFLFFGLAGSAFFTVRCRPTIPNYTTLKLIITKGFSHYIMFYMDLLLKRDFVRSHTSCYITLYII